ncbi:uncharacterized protein LOC108243695 isoform X2 [Kryptolebias marmoratus]|uniref:uncharacterized protein LOC108243695 isoform X2 n=1 Tax=Kryptolebias marmoratus TaxID=37003 RepID=UPI0018ACD54D|nr:uncharacterized protein LOC108243695 isoform X2 [Kryptolebias marmoratus]
MKTKMDLKLSQCCKSVLRNAEPHIPTMDVDFVEAVKEDVTIYQRPAGYSLEIPEDFTFSVEDFKRQELVKPKTLPGWSDNTHKQLDENEAVENGSTQYCTQYFHADTEENQSSSMLYDGAKLDADDTKFRVPVLSFAVCLHTYYIMIQANMFDSFLKSGENVYMSFILQRLDQWDLDDVLKNLTKDRLTVLQRKSTKTVKSQTDADNNQSHTDIMESLVAFCENQAVSEPVKDVHSFRQKTLLDKSLEKEGAELQLSDQERPTVYIDLRYPDPSIKSARTSQNLSPGNTIKNLSESQMMNREVTGKCMLLQQVREMKIKRNTNPDKRQPDDEKMKDKPPDSVESAHSLDSQDIFGDTQASEPKFRTSKIEAQDNPIKEPTQQRQDQDILNHLENHRPTKSVNLKQPAAERTDVLYESEVSHRESISTLPADIESKEYMLLTVRLSSPGMVADMDAAHGKRKHLHSAATRSHIYNTLVAWFLSLAGPERCRTKDDISAQVPFWVAGFQQQMTKNVLALHVLAVAHYSFTPKKKDIYISTLFYNDVSRFLSETSLSAVAEWLPQLRNLLDQQDFASPIHLPPSRLNSFISATSSKKVIDKTFGLSPGFYWQTMETHEPVFKEQKTTQELHTEVSVAVGSSAFFQHPVGTHYTLQLVLDSGLDVCGLRLIYATQGTNGEGSEPVNPRVNEPRQPVLVLAVRGPHAHSVLKSLISSIHPLLHKKTGINSDNRLVCKYHEPPLIHCPQLTSEVHRELCFWFAGRLQARSAQNPNQHPNRITPSYDRVRGSLVNWSRSSSLLCATTKADLLLVVSPAVPPHCYGQVLSVCERRGFSLMGLQRLRLQSNEASMLGLTSHQMIVFCRPPTSLLDPMDLKSPSHCLVLLLSKENMLHHSVSLPSALMREFKAQKLLGCLYSWPDGVQIADLRLCFHTVPYSDSLFHIFVRHMWAVPNPSSVILLHQRCPSQSGMEQQVILTLHGKDMSQNLSFLHRVFTERAKGDKGHAGFELLGLKWLPRLTQLQAQELSPYEVGEQHYRRSVINLMSSSALVCALNGIDAFSTMKKLFLLSSPSSLSVLMSPTPELALRQASLFFFEHELISDRQMFTVCLFKPRVWNQCLAKLICKLQRNGLKMVGLRVVNLDRSYAASCLLEEQVPYLCPGSLALCLQGENAVKKVLDVLGQEDSSQWLTCYGSGSHQQAVRQIKTLFPEGLCCSETSTMKQEQIQTSSSDPCAAAEREQNCALNVTPEHLSGLATSGPYGEFPIHGSRGQTTCMLMPSHAPPHCHMPSQLEMLEQLLRLGCHLVAGRMSTLGNEQIEHITEILTVPSEKMAQIFRAPSLIVALRGEKIVTGLSLLLESIYKDNPILKKVGQMIIYPKIEKEAEQLICYLFEASAQGSGRPMEL